jgi:protein-disulfide isomerase
VIAALLTVTGMLAIAIVFAFLPLVRARAGGRTAQNGDVKQNDVQQNKDAQQGQQGEQNGDTRPGNRPVPLGPRQDVVIGDAPVRGSRNAAVTIVEFADYQCPYCQQMHPELKVLQEELAGKVALVFKDFPLDMHVNAEKAAEAARCAGEQGKYWDFHDILFHNSERLEVPQLKQYARDIKLNQANFDTCLDSGKEAAAIQKDLAQGRQLGVRGTPSFFFNGRMLSGSMDYYTLRGIVEGVIKSDGPSSAAAIPAAPGPGK